MRTTNDGVFLSNALDAMHSIPGATADDLDALVSSISEPEQPFCVLDLRGAIECQPPIPNGVHRREQHENDVQYVYSCPGETKNDLPEALLLLNLAHFAILIPLSHLREHQKWQEYAEVQNEGQEESIVVKSDAIVDPNAVVVHIDDIPVASRTMVAPVWLQRLQHTFETLVLIFWEVWLPAIQQRNESLIPLGQQLLQGR